MLLIHTLMNIMQFCNCIDSLHACTLHIPCMVCAIPTVLTLSLSLSLFVCPTELLAFTNNLTSTFNRRCFDHDLYDLWPTHSCSCIALSLSLFLFPNLSHFSRPCIQPSIRKHKMKHNYLAHTMLISLHVLTHIEVNLCNARIPNNHFSAFASVFDYCMRKFK